MLVCLGRHKNTKINVKIRTKEREYKFLNFDEELPFLQYSEAGKKEQISHVTKLYLLFREAEISCVSFIYPSQKQNQSLLLVRNFHS